MKSVLFYLFVIAFSLFVTIAVPLTLKWGQCTAKAKAQGLECQFGFFTGCMVKIDGRWVDYKKWRVVE